MFSEPASWKYGRATGMVDVTLHPDNATGGSVLLRTESTSTAADGGTFWTRDQWRLRADDLAILDKRYSMGQSGPYSSSYPDEVTTYETPCVELQWPLKVGHSWVSTCTFYETGYVVGIEPRPRTHRSAYTVQAYERVTVAAGTFDAYRIDVQDYSIRSGEQTRWWAPEACGWVKELYQSSQGNHTTELLSFHCNRSP